MHEPNKYGCVKRLERGATEPVLLANNAPKKTDDARAELKHSFEFSMLANPRHEHFRAEITNAVAPISMAILRD